MSLSPSLHFVNASYEQPYAVTSEKHLFPSSLETITISDVTAADYTKTVAAVAVGEYRPRSVVNIAVTNGHFTVNAVVTVAGANHHVGDIVEFAWTTADIPSPRTLTIKDDAATPNTLDTISSTTDTARTLSTRRFQLGTDFLWKNISDKPSTTGAGSFGAVTATTVAATGAVTGASFAATGDTSGATVTATGAVTGATVVATTSVTVSTGSVTLTKALVGSKTWDPASITAPNVQTTTVTVTGALVGDFVTVTLSTLTAACVLTGYVSSSDTVTVVLGVFAGTVDVASGTLKAICVRAV